MKKELLMILCMTIICASVMLGIMGVYKITGPQQKRITESIDIDTSAFKIKGIKTSV